MTATQVETIALEALLDEIRATPKPGLVDLRDSGAHQDMDANTFFASARAVAPYLGRMFAAGVSSTAAPQALFASVRPIGLEAETAMLAVTGSINTHRGAIFTLGLLATATGRVWRERGDLSVAAVMDQCREMAAAPLTVELAAIAARPPRTHGERLYVTCGSAGIRGEAIAGFPALTEVALPALTEGKQPDWNRQLLYTLLHLMTVVEDSTVLHRGGMEGLNWVRQEAAAFLRTYPVLTEEAMEVLANMNEAFIQRNLSPGGCADLLAAAVFLHRLTVQSNR